MIEIQVNHVSSAHLQGKSKIMGVFLGKGIIHIDQVFSLYNSSIQVVYTSDVRMPFFTSDIPLTRVQW